MIRALLIFAFLGLGIVSAHAWLIQGTTSAPASTQNIWLDNGAAFTTIGARNVWTDYGALKE
jgi:hypothetical protein